MTEQKAIEQLSSILNEATEDEDSVCYVTSYDEEPLRMAIKSLEKQIPRVPINKTKPDNGVAQHYENCNVIICPLCERRLKLKSKGNYCDKCGQAIKWE